jgi:hypothetical protein
MFKINSDNLHDADDNPESCICVLFYIFFDMCLIYEVLLCLRRKAL